VSDLTATRDHARQMAAKQPPARPEKVSRTCAALKHADCWRDASLCGCGCHDEPMPTDAERRLWIQIADEIDAYLGQISEAQTDLFGESA